jgi:heme exporter protein CcmD
MAEYFHMSGYAFYVWTSYGLGMAVLVINAWWAWRNLRHEQIAARRRLAMREQS